MKKSLWIVLLLALICTLALSACDDTNQPQTPNEDHVHAFGEWTTVKDATCTVKGEQERICSCGEKETKSIDATGHTEVVDAAVAPACNATGLTEGKHCSVCNETIVAQEVVAKLEHTPTTDAAVAPTCTETGLTEGTHCSVCNEVITKQEIVKANGHTWGVWSQTKAPNCTEKGEERRDCDVCDHYETREVNANGHTNKDAVVENKINETCTADGSYDSVIYCSVCNGEVSCEAKILPKLGHDHSTEWTVDIEPNCTEKGSKSHHCSRCSDKADVTEIAANGHTWGVWSQTKAPNCTEKGEERRDCDVCDHYETREVNANGHTNKDAVVENKIDETCTADGSYDSVIYCSVCSEEVSRETKIIGKLGHDHATEWSVDVEPTCTEKGSKSHHCSRCSDKAEVTEIAANGHTWADNFCASCNTDNGGTKGLVYTQGHALSNGKYAVIGIGTATDTNIVIPSTYNGIPVVVISEKVFSGSNIESITLPEGIVFIGEEAFSYCNNLKEIKLPDSVYMFESRIFKDCINLETVYFGKGIKEIEYAMFENCYKLKNIYNLDTIEKIDTLAFSHCEALSNINLGDSIQEIGQYAFRSCYSLTNIEFPNSVKNIVSYAFYDCKNLVNVKLPNNLAIINNGTFRDCSSLANVYIPKTIQYIDMYAFSKADDVFNIYYEGSNEEWQTINIITEGNYALSRAIVCFYSENDPVDTTYQYWHYVDGVPTLW